MTHMATNISRKEFSCCKLIPENAITIIICNVFKKNSIALISMLENIENVGSNLQ